MIINDGDYIVLMKKRSCSSHGSEKSAEGGSSKREKKEKFVALTTSCSASSLLLPKTYRRHKKNVIHSKRTQGYLQPRPPATRLHLFLNYEYLSRIEVSSYPTERILSITVSSY